MGKTEKANELLNVGGEVPTDGGNSAIQMSEPYTVNLRLRGASDMIFHRWNCEGVDAKGKAAKNSAAKKTDDVPSYVYKDEAGFVCIPGEYLRQSCINAAKFRQDPRSPRKSAMDLYKAALVSLTPLSSLGVKKWDYEDRRRVVVQRNGINRVRPAMRQGWEADFQIMVMLPEYVDRNALHDVVSTAGRLIGLADFRPTYGRFVVVNFE